MDDRHSPHHSLCFISQAKNNLWSACQQLYLVTDKSGCFYDKLHLTSVLYRGTSASRWKSVKHRTAAVEFEPAEMRQSNTVVVWHSFTLIFGGLIERSPPSQVSWPDRSLLFHPAGSVWQLGEAYAVGHRILGEVHQIRQGAVGDRTQLCKTNQVSPRRGVLLLRFTRVHPPIPNAAPQTLKGDMKSVAEH